MDSHIADLSGFSPKVTKRTKVHPGCLRFSSDDDSKSKYKNGLSLSIQSILYHENANTCLPKINLSYTKPLVENSTINYSEFSVFGLFILGIHYAVMPLSVELGSKWIKLIEKICLRRQ